MLSYVKGILYISCINKNKNIMRPSQEQIKNILVAKGYSVSVDSRVWRLSNSGTWQEVRTLEEANNLESKK